MLNKKILTCLLFAFLLFILLPAKVNAITVTVNNTNDAGAGSLREAIVITNTTVGNDLINFNLGAGGPFTITLLSALPTLTDNAGVTIDGWDNAGNPGTPNSVAVFSTSVGTPLNPVYKVVLGNGANIPVGLSLNSSNNLIRGIVLNDFGDGTPSANDICINIAGASNTVVGCYIGMSHDGLTMGPRPYYGIYCTRGNNLIGDGTNAGVNLISGMGGFFGAKIYISGATATANIVRGNIIGLTANGTTALLTASASGIYLIGSAHSNTIGGLGAFDGNLISGNYSTGMMVGTNSNVIQGNYIGPLADGITGLAGTFQSNGLSMGGSFNLLGGSVTAARNLISGNTNLGMDMSGSNNIIRGNYWGPNKFGTARISVSNNSGMAVNTGTGNIIGGTGVGDGNLISGFPGMAIWILFNTGTLSTTVQQNTIGLAANATTSLTGGGNGTGLLMMLNTQNNYIGGNTPSARNIISGSGTGISMSNNCALNYVRGNYIGCAGNGINRVTGASQSSGISITSGSLNFIGGTGAGEGNVISGNSSYGIYLSSNTTSLTSIWQNTIGTQANGTSTLVGGNPQTGIYITNSYQNTIGGITAQHRNLISANSNGVYIDGTTGIRNLISGNIIGTGAGLAPITGATQLNGVRILSSASQNTVGGFAGAFGTNPMGNIIANNTGDGVYIFSTGSDSNLVSRNLIYSNGGAANPINLNYGVNQGNLGKAIPVILTASTNIVTGNNAATGGVGDTVEVFVNSNNNCRDMMSFVGSTLALASGAWTLGGLSLTPGQTVMATARTNANNNTSQSSTCAVILPVELSNFNAICFQNQVMIKWTTMSERNTDYFLIERSEDGLVFDLVTKVNAVGSPSGKQEYSFLDTKKPKENYIYRMRVVDENRSEQAFFANMPHDCSERMNSILLYPNPTDHKLHVSVGSNTDELSTISVFNAIGQLVFSEDKFITAGEGDLDVVSLSKGLYTIKIQSTSGMFVGRFIKE